ncbi:glycosyltransferase [Microvirga sp. 2MCAF38]|uniref:glycosyltransferase n=1 Tax=Microvirga sp. 2MCAF38 TaxID=3232989 RepID=UPI003F98F01C
MVRTATERFTRALSAAALLAQRNGYRIPPFLRGGAKHLQFLVHERVPVDDWSKTLIGNVSLGSPPAADEQAVTVESPHHVAQPQSGPRLKCLVATGVLDVGGSDEVVAFLGRRLPEHGIDTIVVHTGSVISKEHAGGRLPTMLRREGVQVEEVTERSANDLIARYRPDIISAHGAPDWWLRLAAAHKVPYVETLHGMHSFFDTDWAKEAERSSSATAIIAVSELVRRQYINGNRVIDPQRVITVPNSVDPGRLPRIDRDKAREWLNLGNEFLFLSLARHSFQKNNYGLLTAFEVVAEIHPEAHLLIAGRPDNHLYAQQLLRLRDRMSCRDRVHLRDHAPWPSALLAAADGFVQNSYFEGWSLASMEALYAGLPVILSDVGGAREQVGATGQRGYLVDNPIGDALAVNWDTIRNSLYSPQLNRDTLVSAMSRMIEERDLWTERRSVLQTESAERFHPDHALSGHANVLRAAAAKYARSGKTCP